MRLPLLVFLVLSLAVSLTGSTQAQVPQVKITGVRVGFSGGESRLRRYKVGQWTPVYVDVQAGLQQLKPDDYEVVVETSDSDGTDNIYRERRFLPTLEPLESRMLLTYARPGRADSEITVNLRSRGDGHVRSTWKVSAGDQEALLPSVFCYMALGNPLPGMKRALAPRKAGTGLLPDQGGDENEPEEGGIRRFAHVDAVDLLPMNWFGYQAADTIVLTTGSCETFLSNLNRDNDDQARARLKALAEWVRRGGQLLVAVGHNHQLVGQLLAKMELIPLTVKGQLPQIKHLGGVERWANARAEFRGRPSREGELPDIEVARLVPGSGVQVLAFDRPDNRDPEAHPVIVQAPCGLGRVIVLAFDVDLPPFTFWGGQRSFWDTMRQTLEPPQLENVNPNVPKFGHQGGELASQLQDGLEAFPDVPVISFGWVALFILVYIIIVGPLDYFFLKNVVKRLELTWITFPAVVIVISAAAYFAAYYLKGHDLRINKVDVLDIDLHQPHVYGTTWLTLFSPRIQNYTVGIEPSQPSWGSARAPGNDPYSPLVGWMGRPENVYAMGRRTGSQSLFRRTYEYAAEATGLVGVPIQVWSTKSFAASWHRPLAEQDLFEANLQFTKAQENVVGGTITSRLPVDLQEVVLFYRGMAYNLGRLTPNEEMRVNHKEIGFGQAGDVDVQRWYQQGFAQAALQYPSPKTVNKSSSRPGALLKSILFYGHQGDTQSAQNHNSELRYLDQRWRLSRENREEVILVARAVAPVGKAPEGLSEETGRRDISPTRLWLGALPGTGRCPPLAGTLSEETYVRVFIPVKP